MVLPLRRSVMGAADAHEQVAEAGDAAEQTADLHDLNAGEDVRAGNVQRREVRERVGERLVEAEVLGETDGLVGACRAGTIWAAANDLGVGRQLIAVVLDRHLVGAVGMVDRYRGLVGGEADRLGAAERGDDLREDPGQLAAQ
jgi:hypothetical protein